MSILKQYTSDDKVFKVAEVPIEVILFTYYPFKKGVSASILLFRSSIMVTSHYFVVELFLLADRSLLTNIKREFSVERECL